MALKWDAWGEYAMKTKCGKYAINRMVSKGIDVYTAIELPDRVLGRAGSAKEAKTIVESLDVRD